MALQALTFMKYQPGTLLKPSDSQVAYPEITTRSSHGGVHKAARSAGTPEVSEVCAL